MVVKRDGILLLFWMCLCSNVLAQSRPQTQLWEFAMPGEMPQSLSVDADGRPFLYVTTKNGGLLVLRTGSNTSPPIPAARLDTKSFDGLDVMHLAQREQLLYLALGDFFNAHGAYAGLAIVSVQDPAKPVVVGQWMSKEKLGGAATIVVDKKHAYLGAMAHGVMIFDISQPSEIRHLTTFQPDPQFPRKNPTKVQHPNARGFALDHDRLFVAYDAGGIRVLDVSSREKPREIGRYVNTGMGNKQQAYNNLILDGQRLYASIDYAGLEILDVKNPAAIKQLGWWNPWKADTLQNLWFNSPGHTNQLAYDAKKHLVFLSAGDSELQVVNVVRPQQPELVGHFGAPMDGRGSWGIGLGQQAVYLTDMTAVIPFRGTWAGVVAVKRP